MARKLKKPSADSGKRKRRKGAAASIDNIENSHRRVLLKWAVVEHHRTWDNFDGPALQRLRNNSQKFDAKLVKDIRSEYGLGRSLAGSEPKRLGTFLDAEFSQIGSDFAGKISACATISEKIVAKNVARRRQPVAVSKFLWFAAPKGWTMFDDYVSQSLGITDSDCIARLRSFYETLARRGFLNQATAISSTLRENQISMLYGERVIDKFLWLCGAPVVSSRRQIEFCRRYANKIAPVKVKNRLMKTAEQISAKFAADLLR